MLVTVDRLTVTVVVQDNGRFSRPATCRFPTIAESIPACTVTVTFVLHAPTDALNTEPTFTGRATGPSCRPAKP
jgi:hypothetical protein